MKTSERGIEFLKHHEGLRLSSYPDPASGGPPWTCGYGCTKGIHPGMRITLDEADKMLREALVEYEKAVTAAVKVSVSQNAFDALVSWTYNVGAHNMQNSTLIRRLNSADYHGAADSFLDWDHAAGRVMTGLLHRRQEERALFLSA